jgi:hypothetical protein
MPLITECGIRAAVAHQCVNGDGSHTCVVALGSA